MEDNKTSVEDTQKAEDTAKTIDYKAELEKLTAEFQKTKSALEKTNSENADYKRKERERLSDEEKREAELKEREEKYATLERLNHKYELEKTLLGKGFSEEETATLVEKSNDPKEMASAMADILKIRLDSNAKQVKAQTLKTNMTLPDGSTNSTPPTKKDELIKLMQDAQTQGDNILYSKYARALAEENKNNNK